MIWKEQINEIYELATLHSWCSQVNEMIADFNNIYKRNNSIIAYLISILKKKNLPSEYYILSLVLLNYQEYPTEEIIELAITSLYSKLNKNDILFFKEHLFFGDFPLSSDLSEDITNRSFLSPKVAIKKAMKIDSVISKNNPIITVLYMNFILSRMDMNEENRAMVAFLLLRVDIDLPKSLNERVYKYLLEYKDIIQELLQEEKGELIKFDDIASIKEKITKIKIVEKNIVTHKEELSLRIEKPQEINENIEKNKENLTTNIDNIEKITGSIKEKSKIKLHKKTLLQIKVDKEKTDLKNTKSYLEEKELTKQKKDETLIPKPNNLIKKSNKKNNIKNSDTKKNNLPSRETSKAIKGNKASVNIAFEENAVIDNILNNENIDISEEIISRDKVPEDSKKSWQIGLKGNKQILESILAGIGKIGSGNIFLGKNKISNKNKEESNSKKPVFKNRAAIYLIILLTVISVIILLFWGNTKQTDESKSLNREEELIQSDEDVSEISDSYKDSESPNIIMPDDFPINIIIKENKIFWKVLEGESITGLFFALQENKQKFKNTKLENLTNLSWEDFFNTFKNNNPIRESYHIIFPEEEFVIPFN